MAKELVIERIFDAPIEKVWRAWTEPEQFKKWWGPKNFTAPTINIDLRVGGKYLWCMHGKAAPDQAAGDFWNTGEYKEIVPMKKLVYTNCFADKDGNVVPSTAYGMPGFDDEGLVTVVFEDMSGKTKITVRHAGLPEGMLSEMTGLGWNQSFDKMVESLQ